MRRCRCSNTNGMRFSPFPILILLLVLDFVVLHPHRTYSHKKFKMNFLNNGNILCVRWKQQCIAHGTLASLFWVLTNTVWQLWCTKQRECDFTLGNTMRINIFRCRVYEKYRIRSTWYQSKERTKFSHFFFFFETKWQKRLLRIYYARIFLFFFFLCAMISSIFFSFPLWHFFFFCVP